jgi:hypothetical protein
MTPNLGSRPQIVAGGIEALHRLDPTLELFGAVGDNAAIFCNAIYADGPPIVRFNDALNSIVAYGGSCAGFDGTNGNISSDPALVSVPKGNYQLAVGSPAINAGSNTAPVVLKNDYAGHTRIMDGTIDMRAYEVR